MRRSIRSAQPLALVAVCLCVSVPTAGSQECPELVVSEPAGPYGVVAVSGDYAYIGNTLANGGFYVVDVSNPSAPVQVGFLDPGGYFHAAAISVLGSYAYVAAGDEGLLVADVANPTAPFLSAGCCSSVWDVVARGNYAYIARNAGFGVVDIDPPWDPYPVGSASVPGARTLAVSGEYAYVVSDDGLAVIDISTPTAPVIVGSWDATADSPVDVEVSGSYAYLAENLGLRVIDIRSPSAPVEVGYVDTPDINWGVAVSGAYAYLAWADDFGPAAGLRVVEVTTPLTPVDVGSFDVMAERTGVTVSGGYVFFTSDAEGLSIFVDGCGAFLDGFESGDTSAWSCTVP